MSENGTAIEARSQRSLLEHEEIFNEFFDSVQEQLNEDQENKLAEYLKPDALVKRDRLATFLDRLEAEEEICRKQEKRISDRRKRINKLRECLMSSVSTQMELMGLKRINGEAHGFVRCNNPTSVHVFNEDLIPRKLCGTCHAWLSDYMDMELKPNKGLIRQALESGLEVPGCELIKNKTHLEVR